MITQVKPAYCPHSQARLSLHRDGNDDYARVRALFELFGTTAAPAFGTRAGAGVRVCHLSIHPSNTFGLVS